MSHANAIVDRPDVGEFNGLVSGQDYHEQFRDARTVPWTEPGLKVTRLRLLSDPGYPVWDVSYCHGQIGDEMVRVELPFSQLPKRKMRSTIVHYAIADRVWAVRMGVLDAISTLC